MADALWEVYALKYSERNSRTRADSFIFDDDHASPHAMDYFIWVVQASKQSLLIPAMMKLRQQRAAALFCGPLK